MAKNWAAAEAIEAIKNDDRAAIKDIGNRFPLFAHYAACNPSEIVKALPEYLTVRKIEGILKGDLSVEETDADEVDEEVVEKKVKKSEEKQSKRGRKPAKKVEDDDDDDDADDDDDDDEEPVKPAKKTKKKEEKVAKKSKKKSSDDDDEDDDDWDL